MGAKEVDVSEGKYIDLSRISDISLFQKELAEKDKEIERLRTTVTHLDKTNTGLSESLGLAREEIERLKEELRRR